MRPEYKDYIDELGLIVQRDKDGGDSVYRNSLYAIINNDRTHWEWTKALCEVEPGIWVRHPNKNQWYSSPSNCSRDQVAKAMLAAAVFNDKITIKRWLIKQASRFFLHQNNRVFNDVSKWKMPDIMAPNEWANIIRGLNLWVLYPVLIILDTFLLGDLYFRQKNTWDYDSLLAINIWYANKRYVTPTAKLTALIYKNTDYANRIQYNFCRTDNDICPLGQDYVKFMKENL